MWGSRAFCSRHFFNMSIFCPIDQGWLAIVVCIIFLLCIFSTSILLKQRKVGTWFLYVFFSHLSLVAWNFNVRFYLNLQGPVPCIFYCIFWRHVDLRQGVKLILDGLCIYSMGWFKVFLVSSIVDVKDPRPRHSSWRRASRFAGLDS